jgi:hypothetical protein
MPEEEGRLNRRRISLQRLYKYKGGQTKKKTQKALYGKYKFDRTKEEGRHGNWTFLMIGTRK